ncbi:MAG: PatB family C-S lyase [Halioglobus sp.]
MSITQKQKIDFDSAPDRRGGDSFKWNRFADPAQDVIGAWVADMDFLSPPEVLDAVNTRLCGAALGYSDPPDELVSLLVERFWRLYQWRLESSWFVFLPGVVPGLFGAVRATGKEGDSVIAQSPNYHYMFDAPECSERELAVVGNRLVDGRWEMNLDELRTLAGEGASSFLLCNPHNPVGRILTRSELQSVADICVEHGLMICSDEIHADLLLDTDKPHIPIASLSADIEQNSITLVSPSKTFNLPGIGGFAIAIIPNPALRKSFEEKIHGLSVYPSALACTAALAAYRDGGEWLAQLLEYLRANRDYLEREIASMIGLSMAHVEATFLAWINVSELKLDNAFEHFLAHGVALSDGSPMGDSDYLRLNFACSRATLEEIIKRMKKALYAK